MARDSAPRPVVLYAWARVPSPSYSSGWPVNEAIATSSSPSPSTSASEGDAGVPSPAIGMASAASATGLMGHPGFSLPFVSHA